MTPFPSLAVSSKQQAYLLATSALFACHGPLMAASSKGGDKPTPAAAIKTGTDPIGDLNSREIQKREANRVKALAEIERGNQLVGLRQYDGAIQCFVTALGLLPKGPLVEKERQSALQGFSDASLRLVEVRISEGYTQSRPGQPVASAEDILDNLLVLDPTNKAAKRFKEKLNTPGYYNTAMTPAFREDVEKVKKYLMEGQQFLESGRFELAIKRADQVLDIDPYNSAARKLQEGANNEMKSAGESGYNEARSRALRDVTKAWSNPVKRYGNPQASIAERQMVDPSQVEKLRLKIQKLILPEIQFTEAQIYQVADTLTRAAQAADTSERNSGVLILANFPTQVPATASAGPKTSILDLASPASPEKPAGGVIVNTPKIPAGFSLREILDMVTGLADVKWVIKENRVEIVPKTAPTDTLVLRSWTVSPFLFSSSSPRVDDLSSTGLGSGILGAGNANSGASKQAPRRRIDPKEFLSGMNVRFDVQGSTATFNSRNRVLTVYNTVEMLDLVDSIVANSEGQAPVQVDIRAKFVEFTQSNLNELSFDWLMGVSNVPRNKRVFTKGGAAASSDPSLFLDSATGTPFGNAPATTGNRSGGGAIGANAIDALLAGAAGSTSIGPALAVAGAFTDPQFQLLIRAINQRKDVDLLSSPSITARDQEEASIDIVREFLYPTEFSPPQIPTTIGSTISTTGMSSVPSIPVTPTTPSAFQKRDTGVKLKVLPTIKGDNYAIDLELHPEVTEFEGFINYGSPIKTSASGGLLSAGPPPSVVLTENVINQPIFSVRRINTTVTLLDGETIALGGLIREDVQKVNDKTPILGDMPLVGRLFRSKIDQHIKKNLTIFVTARIIDASGQPIKSTKSETETEEVPSLANDRVFGMVR